MPVAEIKPWFRVIHHALGRALSKLDRQTNPRPERPVDMSTEPAEQPSDAPARLAQHVVIDHANRELLIDGRRFPWLIDESLHVDYDYQRRWGHIGLRIQVDGTIEVNGAIEVLGSN